MNQIGPGFVAVIGSIITLAIIAVLVSQRAQTSAVLTGGGTALASIINAAVSPVAGTGTTVGFGSNAIGAQGSVG